VDPVANPSSTSSTVLPRTSGAGRPLQFRSFADHGGIDVLPGDAEIPDQRLIERQGLAGKGTHGQFVLPRHAQFARDENVHRQAQCLGDGESNGYTAARQCQNQRIQRKFMVFQFSRE
jgi:hypothetical protein